MELEEVLTWKMAILLIDPHEVREIIWIALFLTWFLVFQKPVFLA